MIRTPAKADDIEQEAADVLAQLLAERMLVEARKVYDLVAPLLGDKIVEKFCSGSFRQDCPCETTTATCSPASKNLDCSIILF